MEDKLFRFFVSGEKNQVVPGSPLWALPLSGKDTGHSCGPSSTRTTQAPCVTIGDYFSAASQFLSKNNFSILKAGLDVFMQRPAVEDQIDTIIIFLEKHGAFYHPLKIQVVLMNKLTCSFVLNGAASDPGLSLIETEHDLISGLNKTCIQCYLPQVFGIDKVKTGNQRIVFFLGEWFEDYKEFHITCYQDKRSIAIWESDGTCRYILENDAFPIYQEVSRILTYYYNIETFEQISPWHHAAGDFIVRIHDGKFDVKLITVRGYSPFTQAGFEKTDKKANILPSLLFFFANLTLRIRLDKLNGTGKPVMLDEKSIPAIVQGFLQALDEKTLIYDYGNLRKIFLEFIQQFSQEQMMGLMENIIDSYHCDPLERTVLEEILESHCRLLVSNLKNL